MDSDGYFFFFSSRRRHTRLQGDWSSDVCSSDLGVFTPLELPDEDGKTSLAYTYYGGGLFRLFRATPGEPEAIVRPADQAREPAGLLPLQSPLQLRLDEDQKKKNEKLRDHVERAPSVLAGVANHGTDLSHPQDP